MPHLSCSRPLGAVFAILALLILAVPAAARPQIVVDVATGAVLSHEQAFKRWYPASLTKMMTAYVAFRKLDAGAVTLTSPVTLSERASAEPPSKMYYGEGATLTLDTALKIIMVKSANDVATAIGESLAGSQAAFVRLMNAEAARLGMTGSRFINAHGLPGDGQYTTARDMALLARAIKLEYPQYGSYFSIEAIRSGDNVYANYNMLIGRFPGADGMKTGFICSAGFNQVSSATRNGRSVISVVFGAESLADRAERSARLLDFGLTAERSGKVLLADLAPYGENRDELEDLRPVICNPEAAAERAEGRDDDGDLIINSDLILPLTRELVAEEVSLGGTGGAVAFIAADIPLPTPSPRRGAIGDVEAAEPEPTETAEAAMPARPVGPNGLKPALDVPIPTQRPR